MRKVFAVLLGLFFVGAAIILLNEEEFVEEISIITYTGSYSRLITSTEETLSIPIYLSYDESFITAKDSIDSANISGSENVLEVNIADIRNSEYSETLEGREYQMFFSDLTFPNANLTDYFLDLSNASLNLVYVDGEAISLEVGDIYLRFAEIANPGYLDLYRMYALTIDDLDETTAGIVIGLDNVTPNEIILSGIDIGFPDWHFDLGNATYLDVAPDSYMSLVDSGIIDAYSDNAESTTFNLDGDTLIWLPLLSEEARNRTNRFPLLISFEYLGNEYIYMIDDFIFYTADYSLEGNYGRLREFVYRYQ